MGKALILERKGDLSMPGYEALPMKSAADATLLAKALPPLKAELVWRRDWHTFVDQVN